MDKIAAALSGILGSRAAQSLIVFGLLMYPAVYVHEYGHAAVCEYYNLDYEINWEALSISCPGMPHHALPYYWAAGGVIAAAVFSLGAVPAAVHGRTGIMIGVIAVCWSQLFNAALETFAHAWYVAEREPAQALAMLFSISVLVFLWSRYGILRRRENIRTR